MECKRNEIVKTSVALTTILNIFISIMKVRYIEFIYILIFIGFNIYVRGTKNYSEKIIITYIMKKEIINSNKILFIGTNIIIFFYIFKEPYFFLSKYKILILFISIIVGYLTLIFIQKIKIRISLNFLKK